MHSVKHGEAALFFHSDMSMIKLVVPLRRVATTEDRPDIQQDRAEIEVPWPLMKKLLAEYLRSRAMEELEEASDDAILKRGFF